MGPHAWAALHTVSTRQPCWAVAEDQPESLHEAGLVSTDPTSVRPLDMTWLPECCEPAPTWFLKVESLEEQDGRCSFSTLCLCKASHFSRECVLSMSLDAAAFERCCSSTHFISVVYVVATSINHFNTKRYRQTLFYRKEKIFIHGRFSNMCQNTAVVIFYAPVSKQTVAKQFQW